MLSCPFLSQIPKATISKNASRIWPFAKNCPFWSAFSKRQESTGQPFTTPNVEKMLNDIDAIEFESKTSSTVASSISVDPPSGGGVCPFSKNFAKKSDVTVDPPKPATSSEEKLSLRENVGVKQHDYHVSDSVPPPAASFDYSSFFKSEIKRKQDDQTYRVFKRILRSSEDFPYAKEFSHDIHNGKRVTVWCSNDYLGMSRHPLVREAALNAIKEHGTGSGGTRNISGNTPLHEGLEREIASLHGKESALVFTSCFVANETTLYTLGTRLPNNPVILSDSGNHASMIHGIRTSLARKRIFRHNDPIHLEELISQENPLAPKVVAFETVHSMTGAICPLKELLDVTQKYGALSFVDEVHAVGLYGAHGAGVAERDNCMHRIDMITGTLGKAFANIGGYLAGSKDLVDSMRSYGAGFIFTTSLPPATLVGARKAIQILRSPEGQELRTLHQRQVKYLRNSLQQVGIPVIDCPSHIIPVHVGDPELSAQLSNQLMLKHHMYVQHINYPTVPRGQERLRIAPSPFHNKALCDELVSALVDVWQEFGLPLNTSHHKDPTVLNAASAA